MSGLIVLALRLLLALALYGFLGWALYTLWQDTQREAKRVATRRIPGINLTVRSGSEKTSSSRHFLQSEIILGRDPICDIYISDETVSARHARLTFHHGQWWVEDLNSTNGTRLNQEPVSQPTVLTTGDEIGLGATQLIVSLSMPI
ncbi:MAG TPA: FHA domain-containing protein [Anaerolineales bacterium]|nr:FHA domain-containing protein [Anaerolineales bacterium]